MTRVGSLFAGIGGADLALESLGCETVWHAEIDPYASEVFARRFPRSTNLGDVTKIVNPPAVDILVGGFPCQDISAAGKGAGIVEGTRSGLWSEYARLIGELRPRLVLIENVSMLLRRGMDVVLADLDRLEYAVEWDCVPAAAVGAPHLRDRIWMVAYPEDAGPLHVFGDASLEKSLATLHHPPSKWPRAGRMEQGAVYVSEPVAPRKTKRLNPGSAWVGASLTRDFGWWHEATLWPTPRASWNENRTRKPAPSHGVTHGRLLAGEANRIEAEEGRPTGLLNPTWVEWLMGFPMGWTDLHVDLTMPHGWGYEPDGIPRVSVGTPKRRERLTCCGNALVPQVMRWVAGRALDRLADRPVAEPCRLVAPDGAQRPLWPTPNAEGGTGYMSGSKRDVWRPTLEAAVKMAPDGPPPGIDADRHRGMTRDEVRAAVAEERAEQGWTP